RARAGHRAGEPTVPGRAMRVPRRLRARGFTVLAVAALLVAGLAAAVLAQRVTADRDARTAPALPQVSAAELISSIRSARPGPLAGTVRVDERFGLVQPGRGAVLARLWSDGAGRRRISLPGVDGERTIVDDGHSVWTWNSTTRSVSRAPSTP